MTSFKPGAATQNYDLGNSGISAVATKVIQIAMGSLLGQFVVAGRMTDSGQPYKPIPYRKRYLNGAVADDSMVSAAISGDSIIEVNAAGLDIQLQYAHTSGTNAGALVTHTDLSG